MRYWVFTTKPGHFNMSEALIPGETLDWPTFSHFKFEVGDLVFFYASSPVLQMIGKCEIIENNLDFSDVDPRNDLRKWPRHHSSIPWLRLRVVERAPIPFKPLQRGSLYYHTEFKPSPYPKLLHENEIGYVLRAFDEIKDYNDFMTHTDGGLNPLALNRVINGTKLKETADEFIGGKILALSYSDAVNDLEINVGLRDNDQLVLKFSGLKRVIWNYDRADSLITGFRITIDDTYLLVYIDGAGVEVLAEALTVE